MTDEQTPRNGGGRSADVPLAVALNAGRRLSTADTPRAVYEATVEAADRLLEAASVEVGIADGSDLVVVATAGDAVSDEPRRYSVAMSVPGAAYTRGTACVVDDCGDTRSAAAGDVHGTAASPSSHRSLLCVPLADRGVLVLRAAAPGAFDEGDRAVAEALVSCAEAALDRTAATAGSPPAGVDVRGDEPDRLEAIAEILSHDLASLLSVAQGSVELARSTDDPAHFERAETALSRLDEFVDGVVSLARTGAYVDSPEPVAFAAVLERAWTVLPTGEATLEIVDSATILASDRGLSQLLENVVDNAISHAGPAVAVRAGVTDDGFYVEDDGPGIAEADWAAVFDRGYSSADGHAGLGLTIAHRIAEAHGWTLRAAAAEAGGARFEISGVERLE